MQKSQQVHNLQRNFGASLKEHNKRMYDTQMRSPSSQSMRFQKQYIMLAINTRENLRTNIIKL